MQFLSAFRKRCIAATIIACVSGAFLLPVSCLPVHAAEQKAGYSRSDCIVKIVLRNHTFSEQHWRKLTSNISGAISSHKFDIRKHDIANISVPYVRQAKAHAIYMQFFRDCDDRLDLAKSAMNDLKEQIPDFPRYFVSRERIIPNPKTIDACGPFWSDCKPLNLPRPTMTLHQPSSKK